MPRLATIRLAPPVSEEPNDPPSAADYDALLPVHFHGEHRIWATILPFLGWEEIDVADDYRGRQSGVQAVSASMGGLHQTSTNRRYAFRDR